MSKSKKAARSAIIIAFLTLGSKFLGFIRETLIAAKFGAGIKTDTFFIAITVTGLVTGLIGTAVKTTFVPVLSEVEAREGKGGKIAHTVFCKYFFPVGGADIFLDGLGHQTKTLPVFQWTHCTI